MVKLRPGTQYREPGLSETRDSGPHMLYPRPNTQDLNTYFHQNNNFFLNFLLILQFIGKEEMKSNKKYANSERRTLSKTALLFYSHLPFNMKFWLFFT